MYGKTQKIDFNDRWLCNVVPVVCMCCWFCCSDLTNCGLEVLFLEFTSTFTSNDVGVLERTRR